MVYRFPLVPTSNIRILISIHKVSLCEKYAKYAKYVKYANYAEISGFDFDNTQNMCVY